MRLLVFAFSPSNALLPNYQFFPLLKRNPLLSQPHRSLNRSEGRDIFVIGAIGDAHDRRARIEFFLAEVLALEGKDPNAIREGVHVAIANREQIFKAQEVNRRMKDKAAHACRALCRERRKGRRPQST